VLERNPTYLEDMRVGSEARRREDDVLPSAPVLPLLVLPSALPSHSHRAKPLRSPCGGLRPHCLFLQANRAAGRELHSHIATKRDALGREVLMDAYVKPDGTLRYAPHGTPRSARSPARESPRSAPANPLAPRMRIPSLRGCSADALADARGARLHMSQKHDACLDCGREPEGFFPAITSPHLRRSLDPCIIFF
jgi:hypothetical protein